MSSNDTTTLVVRYLEAALAAARSGDFTAADELVAEDAEFTIRDGLQRPPVDPTSLAGRSWSPLSPTWPSTSMT